MIRSKIPKVALLTCSSYRVNRESVLSVHGQAVSQLVEVCKDIKTEPLSAPKVAVSDEELEDNLKFLSSRQPAGLVLHYAGWTEDETVLKIVSSFNCPVLLWATGDIFKDGISQLVSHVGYMESVSFLKKSGYEVFRFYGGPDESSSAELKSFLTAVRTFHALKNLKFGWIGSGYGSKGILDSSFNEALLEGNLGITFPRIPLEEFFSLYRKMSSLKKDEEEKILSKFGLHSSDIRSAEGTDASTIDDSLRVLWALSRIVEENKLDAFSLRCFPEFKENDVPTPCLAISAMNNIGIPASCEGDVLSGISMFILTNLSGLPSTMMDIFSCDETQNTMNLFHCGSAAESLAGEKCIVYKSHCKPRVHRAGVTVEFPLSEGDISLVKLDYLHGQFSLYACTADSVSPDSFLRGNQATIRLRIPIKSFIERLLDEGVSHHMVLSMGAVCKEAEFLARMAGFRFVCM